MSDEQQIITHDERTSTPEVKHSRNETVLFGRTIPLPIYTVVFIALAVLTVIEVLIGTAPHGALTVPALVIISGAKAVMVVMFYMHLRDDSKVFTIVLIFPLLIALIAVLFLLLVPPVAYPG